MRVLIDGDAFPDIEDIINICKKYHKRVIIYTDTSHVRCSSAVSCTHADALPAHRRWNSDPRQCHCAP